MTTPQTPADLIKAATARRQAAQEATRQVAADIAAERAQAANVESSTSTAGQGTQ